MIDKTALIEPIQSLVTDPEAQKVYAVIAEVCALAHRLPIKLCGEAAQFNPLVRLCVQDCEAFNNVVALVERKRQERGLSPLVASEPEKKFDKNEYQRELMAEIRSRTTAAADVENLRRPPSAKLVGHTRMEFMSRQQRKWKTDFNAILEKASGGKTVTKAKRQELAVKFWSDVEEKLAQDEAAVLQWIQSGRKGPAP